MEQAISGESRKKRRRERKKLNKKKGWNRSLLSWISGVMRRLFGSTFTTHKEVICEVAKFCSENHAHIVCEYAKHKFVPIVSFLGGTEVLKSYVVPGMAVKTEIKVTEKIFSRFLIGILVRFELLHSEGKTLNGCYSAESIWVPDEDLAITPHLDVKFKNIPFDVFQPYTEKGGNLDLMRLGWIIKHDILSSETELPADLTQLLDLLKSDPVSKKSLIYSHVSLKGLKEKLSYFMWMYKRVLYLKMKHHDKYNNIMQKISRDTNWRGRAFRNNYLARLRPIVGNGMKGGYSNDGEGESRFYRNAVEHLPMLLQENNTKLVQKNGPQPPSQENGAISGAQRNASHPAANKMGTQLSSNKPTAQRSGAQQSPNQPPAQRNGFQPTTHKKGAQPEAQTKGIQLASGDDEEELEEYHTAIVLLRVFPEFLGHLQEAIYVENELESCNAEGPVTHGKNTVCRFHS